MWDETRQGRLENLQQADASRLPEPTEQAELAALIAERCHLEEAAIAGATHRIQAEYDRLA